ACGRGGRVARRLTAAAVPNAAGRADQAVGANAVAHGRRGVLARGLADAAGGGRRADLAGGAGAVAHGRAVLARGLADAVPAAHHAALAARPGAVPGSGGTRRGA